MKIKLRYETQLAILTFENYKITNIEAEDSLKVLLKSKIRKEYEISIPTEIDDIFGQELIIIKEGEEFYPEAIIMNLEFEGFTEED